MEHNGRPSLPDGTEILFCYGPAGYSGEIDHVSSFLNGTSSPTEFCYIDAYIQRNPIEDQGFGNADESGQYNAHQQEPIPGSSNNDEQCNPEEQARAIMHPFNTDEEQQQMPMCYFFMEGRCNRGRNCLFRHTVTNSVAVGEIVPQRSATMVGPQEPGCASLWDSEGAQGVSPTNSEKHKMECTQQGDQPRGTALSREKSTDTASKEDPQELFTFAPIVEKQMMPLCPFFMNGKCNYGLQCWYIHGELCHLCGQNCLDPTNEASRLKHTTECSTHQRAIARSRDQMCGICMDIVTEKMPQELQKFGILLNCNHCFCLDCIKKWRCGRDIETNNRQSCPQCRVHSNFVCPSPYWVDSEEEKNQLIERYKKAMSRIACKYFSRTGRETCPFGNQCFYQHAAYDGTIIDIGPPRMSNPSHRVSSELRMNNLENDMQETLNQSRSDIDVNNIVVFNFSYEDDTNSEISYSDTNFALISELLNLD